MKILTVCLEGGSRSPGAAHVLRGMGHNAQSVALNENAPAGKTRITEQWVEWADKIIVFFDGKSDKNDEMFKTRFPDYIFKTVFVLQPDLWGGPVRQEHFDHFEKLFKEHPEYLK